MTSFFRMKAILLGISFFIAGTVLAANVYTLPQLLERALNENPELKALKLEVEGQDSLRSQAGLWENPVFEIGADRKEEPEGNTNFSRFGVSQSIPRWGKLNAQSDFATSELELLKLQQTASGLRFQVEFIQRIFQYKIAVEKSHHAEERLARFRTVQSYLRSRPFAAPQKKAEAMIVRSKLKVLQQNLRELSAKRKAAWNSVNEFLNFPDETKIQLGWVKQGTAYRLEDLLQRAEFQNPEIREALLKISQSGQRAELVGYETWPGLTLSGAFANGIGQKPEKVYGLGLSFPLPVFNFNRGAVRAAEAGKAAGEFRLQQAKRKISSAIKSAFADYEAARQSLTELSTEDFAEMEREMSSIDESFKKGQVELMTYLEADTQHVEQLNATLEVQQDLVNHQGELLLLTGQNIEMWEL